MFFSFYIIEMVVAVVGLFVVLAVVAYVSGRKDHAENELRVRRAAGERDAILKAREARKEASAVAQPQSERALF